MIRSIFITGFIILSIVVSINKACSSSQIDYSLWAKVLKEYVNDDGRVNYADLKKNRTDLDAFVKQVGDADILNMSKNEQKAFWINAYNALTVRLIVDKYPLKLGGIRTINLGRPWSIKMRVAQQDLTLGHIEHKILRKWDPPDPRVHFALNCASIGCPKLPKAPFDPVRLDEQMDKETKRFINDPQKVRLDKESNILYHSEIFNWFDEDFLAISEDKLSYIKPYLSEEDKAYLDSHDVQLKKLEYDWGLNKQ